MYVGEGVKRKWMGWERVSGGDVGKRVGWGEM